MKLTTRSKIALLALGLCGALVFALWPRRVTEQQGAGSAEASLAREPAPSRRLLTLDELHRAGWAKARPSEADPSASGPDLLDRNLAGVLDSDPRLRKFHDLRRKALRTSVEQQDYLDMISDGTMIDEARRDMLAVSSHASIDQGEELRRLQRIQYLNSALAWKDNPERKKVVEAFEEILFLQIPTEASESVKGSMLGDKIDLFQILMMSEPARAEALLDQARGTSLEKVFQLAWRSSSSSTKTKASMR